MKLNDTESYFNSLLDTPNPEKGGFTPGNPGAEPACTEDELGGPNPPKGELLVDDPKTDDELVACGFSNRGAV